MIDVTHRKGIFKDRILQEEFWENGFVVVPFISKKQILDLKNLYSELHPNGVEGFYSTTFANNVEHRNRVNSSIKQICIEEINKYFKEFKIYFSSFIVKAPGVKSELVMHQDMTLVNEDKYSGINIWCPLIDLTDKNGAIQLLPKSHRICKTYRGASLPDIYDGVKEQVLPLMHSLYLKAGEAVIFDQSIIHYSPPNLSAEERPVINTFVGHKDSEINICYWDKKYNDKIEVFKQGDDFLEQFENFGHNIFNKPTIGESLGYVSFDFPKLNETILEENFGLKKLKESNKEIGFKNRFKALFKRNR